MIGGNGTTTVHAANALTSPVIDLTQSPNGAKVTLELWRFLNSDDFPYNTERVEVLNAASTWVTLYTNPASNLDISAYRHAGFRVRVTHQVTSGSFAAAGWNIDDVKITADACK